MRYVGGGNLCLHSFILLFLPKKAQHCETGWMGKAPYFIDGEKRHVLSLLAFFQLCFNCLVGVPYGDAWRKKLLNRHVIIYAPTLCIGMFSQQFAFSYILRQFSLHFFILFRFIYWSVNFLYSGEQLDKKKHLLETTTQVRHENTLKIYHD